MAQSLIVLELGPRAMDVAMAIVTVVGLLFGLGLVALVLYVADRFR